MEQMLASSVHAHTHNETFKTRHGARCPHHDEAAKLGHGWHRYSEVSSSSKGLIDALSVLISITTVRVCRDYTTDVVHFVPANALLPHW